MYRFIACVLLAFSLSACASGPLTSYLNQALFEVSRQPFGTVVDVTDIVEGYEEFLNPNETLVQAIEEEMKLVSEFQRSESSDELNARQKKTNKRLDTYNTDYKRVYQQSFNGDLLFLYRISPFHSYELTIEVYREQGKAEDTIRATLRYISFYI